MSVESGTKFFDGWFLPALGDQNDELIIHAFENLCDGRIAVFCGTNIFRMVKKEVKDVGVSHETSLLGGTRTLQWILRRLGQSWIPQSRWEEAIEEEFRDAHPPPFEHVPSDVDWGQILLAKERPETSPEVADVLDRLLSDISGMQVFERHFLGSYQTRADPECWLPWHLNEDLTEQVCKDLDGLSNEQKIEALRKARFWKFDDHMDDDIYWGDLSEDPEIQTPSIPIRRWISAFLSKQRSGSDVRVENFDSFVFVC